MERRKHTRVSLNASARALVGWQEVLECHVRDISLGGACLEFHTPAVVPDQFDLFVRNPPLDRACRVVWRAGARLGVQFQAT
jgi:hypothetical protein